MELNDEKREPPRAATCHLGFQIDLQQKIVSITQKHSGKILNFFKRFIICASSYVLIRTVRYL